MFTIIVYWFNSRMGLKICTKHTATVAISWLLRLFKGPRGSSGSLWTHESTSTPACQIDGCDGCNGCWGICGKLGGTPDMLKRAWTCRWARWAFAPFSEVEESAKVLQYLESEWLCVPWMSEILLQTSTFASAWNILPDTLAHQRDPTWAGSNDLGCNVWRCLERSSSALGFEREAWQPKHGWKHSFPADPFNGTSLSVYSLSFTISQFKADQ